MDYLIRWPALIKMKDEIIIKIRYSKDREDIYYVHPEAKQRPKAAEIKQDGSKNI